jgi:hypothetical protein
VTDTRKFDELVSWHAKPVLGVGMGWDPGWRPNGGAFADNISPSDPYWNTVLDKAQAAYGDPGMRFSTADPGQDRHLVFSDGTPVPADGSLAYRDHGQTYALNDDGSVSQLGANGQRGQPFFPEFHRNAAGQYVPVDAHGQQVAPLAASYVDDPATGKRTYYNANGNVVGSEQRKATPPGAQHPGGLETDEQQSGRTADAVRKLHDELKDRYSKLSDAEGKLSEVMLTAQATTAEGQKRLNDIQQKIVEAVNNPALALDTPAGEQAFLKFLRSQVAAIGEVLQSGTLTAEDQSKAAAALAELYAADGGPSQTGGPSEPNAEATPPPAAAAAASPPVTDAGLTDPGLTDAGLGPMEPMPEPLSDLGMGGPLGADPLAGLASALPAAMGAFPPGGGMGGASPLDALTGPAGPLAGLASQLGEQARRGDPTLVDEPEKDKADDERDEDDKAPDAPAPDEAPPATTPQSGAPPEPTPAGTPGENAPPAAPGPPPPPPTTITLPDGSTANARTPELAQAVKAHLDGKPLEEAYREQRFELPPPGTPVTNPVDPSRLSAGMLGTFKDHFVVALSSVKALQDGQVVPLSSIAASPDFLGWLDPSAVGVPAPTPAPVPAPTPPPSSAAPLASSPIPAPIG